MNEYDELLIIYKDYFVLENISSLIRWDSQVNMPEKAVQQRADQMNIISGLIHEKKTNPRIGEIINQLENENNSLNEVQKRNIVLIKREYNKVTKLPIEFVKESSSHTQIAIKSWKEAKKGSNFLLFKEDLNKNIEIAKKYANFIDPEKISYDVLLDKFEPNITSDEVTQIFNNLKPKLIDLIQKIQASNTNIKVNFLKKKVSLRKQTELVKEFIKIVNFDLEGGRIDETEHPFASGYMDDVRITTKYHENKFSNALFASLHESGHGVYHQNLPYEFKYQPISNPVSSSVHESQSRFVENIIGRSYSFWKFYYPKLKEMIGDELPTLDEFYKGINNVEFSKIRIYADEVTYCLHIILRYELERDIMTDNIELDKLPQIWNERIKKYFGLDIENDAEGVLQDIHWSLGIFGYFPTYALGNIFSAQLLNTMNKEFNVDESLLEGNVNKVIKWLNKNIHNHGNKYDMQELCELVTGEKLNSKYYIDYLTQKYSKIYNL